MLDRSYHLLWIQYHFRWEFCGESMHSSIITIDIRPDTEVTNRFYGSIARGWFGSVMKCRAIQNCGGCLELFDCPYYMVFKERNDIKPYALLAFPHDGTVRTIIRVHGDRRRLIPKIVNQIYNREKLSHFGGFRYTIDEIHATEIDIPDATISPRTEIVFLSPLCLKKQHVMELIPSFNSILIACIRTYNRICKYYECGEYPLRVSDEVHKADARIVSYDIRTVRIIHECMDDRRIPLEGVIGSVTYDTSGVPSDAGKILKAGELLQIGKHTTYGFGGMYVKKFH